MDYRTQDLIDGAQILKKHIGRVWVMNSSPSIASDGKILNAEALRYKTTMPEEDARALIEILNKDTRLNQRLAYSQLPADLQSGSAPMAEFEIPFVLATKEIFGKHRPETIGLEVARIKTRNRQSEKLLPAGPQPLQLTAGEEFVDPLFPVMKEETAKEMLMRHIPYIWELEPSDRAAKGPHHFIARMEPAEARALNTIMQRDMPGLAAFGLGHEIQGEGDNSIGVFSIPVAATQENEFWQRLDFVTTAAIKVEMIKGMSAAELEAYRAKHPVEHRPARPADPEVRRIEQARQHRPRAIADPIEDIEARWRAQEAAKKGKPGGGGLPGH